MAGKDKGKQMPSQGAPAAPEVNPQMPMELEQTVKEMMQHMETFKRDPRLQHLFVQGEASSTALMCLGHPCKWKHSLNPAVRGKEGPVQGPRRGGNNTNHLVPLHPLHPVPSLLLLIPLRSHH